MAQFSIYKNNGRNKGAYPYFIDIQSELLAGLNTCLVMPLAFKNMANSQVKKITPSVLINGQEFVILANMLTTLDKRHLKETDIVIKATEMRDEILSAIDLLIAGI
jgi:toxin CcdB